MSQAGAMSTSAWTRPASCRPLAQQRAQQKQGDVAAHARANENLRARSQSQEDSFRFLQPAADLAVLQLAARLAMSGVVEARAADAQLSRPLGKSRRLGARHLRLEARQPHDSRTSVALDRVDEAGDAALGHAAADGQELRCGGRHSKNQQGLPGAIRWQSYGRPYCRSFRGSTPEGPSSPRSRSPRPSCVPAAGLWLLPTADAWWVA